MRFPTGRLRPYTVLIVLLVLAAFLFYLGSPSVGNSGTHSRPDESLDRLNGKLADGTETSIGAAGQPSEDPVTETPPSAIASISQDIGTPTPVIQATSAPSPMPVQHSPTPTQVPKPRPKDFVARTIQLWSDYLSFGGNNTFGPPIGKQFEGRGDFYYQAYQRGVLQWRPDLRRAVLANTFDWLTEAGLDTALYARGIPLAIIADGSHGDWLKARETRLSWLTNPEIKARFLANPNPTVFKSWNVDKSIELYGLPSSKPERFGPFITQRFQRIALQLWVEDVQGMPAKGSVVGILGGMVLKENGLIPLQALDGDPAAEDAKLTEDGYDPWVGLQLPINGRPVDFRLPSRLPNAPRAYRAGIHEGIDFYDLAFDTPVHAVREGRIMRIDHEYEGLTSRDWAAMSDITGRVGFTPEDMLDIFRGRQVWVEHFHGVVSRYAHLRSVRSDLRVGDWVSAGDLLGGAGNSGTEENVAHLHLEVWYGGKFLGQGQSLAQLTATIRRAFGS